MFSGSYRSRCSGIDNVSRAPLLLLLLLLSHLCSNAPRGTSAAVFIGSMAVREKEKERREGIVYRRYADCHLYVTPMKKGVRI